MLDALIAGRPLDQRGNDYQKRLAREGHARYLRAKAVLGGG
jgi:hypothetical protein